jgi:hypothetical protein
VGGVEAHEVIVRVVGKPARVARLFVIVTSPIEKTGKYVAPNVQNDQKSDYLITCLKFYVDS